MTVYKLTDDFFDDSYALVAIHSSLDSYRLAYFLNGLLGLQLHRPRKDLVLYDGVDFETYEAYDKRADLQWHLVANKTTVVQKSRELVPDMFGGPVAERTYYVLPEYPKVDHLLKIDDGEGGMPPVLDILKKIKHLPGLITAYEVDTDRLKSKDNLIFLANA